MAAEETAMVLKSGLKDDVENLRGLEFSVEEDEGSEKWHWTLRFELGVGREAAELRREGRGVDWRWVGAAKECIFPCCFAGKRLRGMGIRKGKKKRGERVFGFGFLFLLFKKKKKTV